MLYWFSVLYEKPPIRGGIGTPERNEPTQETYLINQNPIGVDIDNQDPDQFPQAPMIIP